MTLTRIGMLTVVCLLAAVGAVEAEETEGLSTVILGNDEGCDHRGALKLDGDVLHVDLSALPAGARVQQAILRVPFRRRWGHEPTQISAVGFADGRVSTQPPGHSSFDLTRMVRAWLAEPAANRGLKIVAAGRADFRNAALDVSVLAKVAADAPAVRNLRARHRDGQTFLTWAEPEDVVGSDAPTFEAFEKAVLAARRKRTVTYRVYRHDRPITPANLADAEIVREVPEALSCWNLLAVPNTEHPQAGRTKRSPLRGGNLVLRHVMTRWRLDEVVGRSTGLAVVTATKPGTRYYAVSVVRNGREAAAGFGAGANAVGPVDERPSKSPAIFHQRTRQPDPRHRGTSPIDVFVCWMEPPLVPRPRPVEVYLPRWPDLPAGSAERRLPLYVNLGTYGTHAAGMSSPLWHYVRRYVPGAITVGLAEEGTLWTGQH